MSHGLQDRTAQGAPSPDPAAGSTPHTVSLVPPWKATDPSLGEVSYESAVDALGEWKSGILPIQKFQAVQSKWLYLGILNLSSLSAPSVTEQKECEEVAKYLSHIKTKYPLSAISLACFLCCFFPSGDLAIGLICCLTHCLRLRY